MHTEDEAKERWCPFARAIVLEQTQTIPSHNRVVKQNSDDSADESWSPIDCRCISSQCMAWRQGYKDNPCYQPTPQSFPDNRLPNERNPYITDTERGYCGLAGKP